ncbi:MAG: hypothetical protein IH621_02995 [Krumholzibacteria bacterium]|nr:hypothetical protein [Candidatus Krumholzibacteria bacterium]
MNRFLLAALLSTLLPAAAVAAEYALIWNGPVDNGIETRIPGFFAGEVGAGNAGVHLVIGDAPAWEACTHRIDLGEIERRDYDGFVVLDIGGLIEQPPFYAYFVRGDDHQVHAPHEVFYTAGSGRPVIGVDAGPPGQPGQPVVEGGGS